MKNTFSQRNAAIDILRALVMLLMIFVNDLWSIDGEPEWLGHASAMQDFMGLADIVFPCFLIVVGMSIPYAIESRMAKGCSGVSTVGHILTRSMALMIMGVFTVNTENGVLTSTGMTLPWFRILMVAGFLLVWNAYPHTKNAVRSQLYSLMKLAGLVLLVFLAITYRTPKGDYFQSSWWGILGIIGWTYLICAMMYLFTRSRLRYLVPAWCACALLCMLRSIRQGGGMLLEIDGRNFFDQILSMLHIENGCFIALTTGGIIISVISVRYGLLTNMRRMAAFAIPAACAALAAGLVCNKYFIVSKIMATAPWLFYNLAIAIAAYGLLIWVVKAGKANWFSPIKAAGTATLTCYILPYATYSIAAVAGVSLPLWLRTGLPGIANCAVYAYLIILLAHLLGKAGIRLKV